MAPFFEFQIKNAAEESTAFLRCYALARRRALCGCATRFGHSFVNFARSQFLLGFELLFRVVYKNLTFLLICVIIICIMGELFLPVLR